MNDASDWIEISAVSPEVDDVGMDITSHLTSAKRVLDDIGGRVAALQMSERVIADVIVMSDTCDADVDVSTDVQFTLVNCKVEWLECGIASLQFLPRCILCRAVLATRFPSISLSDRLSNA